MYSPRKASWHTTAQTAEQHSKENNMASGVRPHVRPTLAQLPRKTFPQLPRKAPFFETLFVGGVAGIVGAAVVFPLDAVKTRLQGQGGGTERLYRGPLHCFRSILAQEGPRGLYRGLVPNLMGIMRECVFSSACFLPPVYNKAHPRCSSATVVRQRRRRSSSQ